MNNVFCEICGQHRTHKLHTAACSAQMRERMQQKRAAADDAPKPVNAVLPFFKYQNKSGRWVV